MMSPKRQLLLGVLASALLISGLMFSMVVVLSHQAYASDSSFYQQTNLVSDQKGVAPVIDSKLVNAWGIAASSSSPFWIADNRTGVSTIYNGQGKPLPSGAPLVVTIPVPTHGTGVAAPTGIVFNGSSSFVVSRGKQSGVSLFIFDTEDGTISGWNPNVDRTHAILAVDQSASGAVYKGLAIGRDNAHDFIFATNFHAGTVDVFNATFHAVKSFTDSKLPKGYAPFGIQNIGGKLYVTFALQKADKHGDQAGRGNGFVDIFSTNGTLLSRLIAHNTLNSPWGLALAPASFGPFSNALLVGNLGDGRINAFNAQSGAFLGTLSDQKSKPIVIDGLWGLLFGNGGQAGERNTLFFTAGPDKGSHGLFGSIKTALQPTPTPTPVPQQTVTITTNSSGIFTFSPTTLTITVGTTVIWKNTTQATHTATSDDGKTFDSGNISSGGTFRFTFTKTGTFTYHCNIHPFMTATIIVK